MTEYYFLAACLPELSLGEPPALSWNALTTLLQENLIPEDAKQMRSLRFYYDLENLRALLANRPLQPYGNWSQEELEERWKTREGFPDYAEDFFQGYSKAEDRLAHFPELLQRYFLEEGKRAQGFLKSYLTFEREMRLVLVGLRSRTLERPLELELLSEERGEPLIAQMFAQKEQKAYEPPKEFQDLKKLFEEFRKEPTILFEELFKYRFQKVREMVGTDSLSIDPIMAYTVQFILVEKWRERDREEGRQVLQHLLR